MGVCRLKVHPLCRRPRTDHSRLECFWLVSQLFLMIGMLWNCLGTVKPSFRRSMRYLLRKFNPDFVALFETHCSGVQAQDICDNMGFDCGERVEADGQSGGIWLLWHSSKCMISIITKNRQFIHAIVGEGDNKFHLFVVYISPDPRRRDGVWEVLENLMSELAEPIVIGGDFNVIRSMEERQGGSGRLSRECVEFRKWLENRQLVDLGYHGTCFTWRRGNDINTRISKRLDRVCVSLLGRARWQEASVHHLPRLSSDHNPLLLSLNGKRYDKPSRRPFRCQAAWFSHPDFVNMVSTKWDTEAVLPAALGKLQGVLKKWNREVFGDIISRKNDLVVQLEKVQKDLETQISDTLIHMEFDVITKLNTVLE